MSEATDVKGSGGKTWNTFPLYILGEQSFKVLLKHVRLSTLKSSPGKPNAGHLRGFVEWENMFFQMKLGANIKLGLGAVMFCSLKMVLMYF